MFIPTTAQVKKIEINPDSKFCITAHSAFKVGKLPFGYAPNTFPFSIELTEELREHIDAITRIIAEQISVKAMEGEE